MTDEHSDQAPVFIPLSKAAERFGIRYSTLRRWVSERRIASYTPSRRVLIDVRELEAYIRAHRREPADSSPCPAD